MFKALFTKHKNFTEIVNAKFFIRCKDFVSIFCLENGPISKNFDLEFFLQKSQLSHFSKSLFFKDLALPKLPIFDSRADIIELITVALTVLCEFQMTNNQLTLHVI